MAGAAKFMAKELIDVRFIEFNPRIIHNTGNGHQVEIGAQQNQAVRYIGCAKINIDGRSCGDRDGPHSPEEIRPLRDPLTLQEAIA